MTFQKAKQTAGLYNVIGIILYIPSYIAFGFFCTSFFVFIFPMIDSYHFLDTLLLWPFFLLFSAVLFFFGGRPG